MLTAPAMDDPAIQNPQSEIRNRTLRVFISSTFRDMHAERDHLVTVIFPQLRRLCESRGVTWGEVDLRWGVTDEAAAEGQVLSICLEEINRCRPWFIGLLGERYGWVPQSIPEELLGKESWLREQFRAGKSVTELEILHGVLLNPTTQAFFYLRDPAYVNSVPEGNRKDFLPENADDERRLRTLKETIRRSGLPVRENYANAKVLGELVLADLTDVIDRHWPEGSEPDPLTREALDHAAYARSRERVYIGRAEYFARLDEHTCGEGEKPLVILGESGSGKSALLANWAAHYRQAHPDAFVLEHYIGATPASGDWAAMLRRIMGEFNQRLGLTQEIPDHPDGLRSAFPNWLHMAAAKGRVILILDALNQLEDQDGAPDLIWLPPVMPANVRLIVSTLPGRALEEIGRRQWPLLRMEPLMLEERRELIWQFLSDYGRTLSPARVERIVRAPQSANPLYLRVLLDELRLFGIYERLEERIGYYLEAVGPRELYQKVIARWEENYGKDLTCETLSLLWAARRGLSEAELLDVLGRDGQPLPRAAWSPLFLAVANALVSRGGLLTFTHDFLRVAARNAYVPTGKQQQVAHIQLADYFERQPSGSRRTDELPWQLAEAKAWQRLYDLLSDREFFTDTWERNPFEVRACWAQVETGSGLRMVDAWRAQIEHPEIELHKNHLSRLGILLAESGHPEEALRLQASLAEHFRSTSDQHSLQRSLGNQANILYARGNLDDALALHKEAELISRQLGNLEVLQTTLGNEALIMRDRGDLDCALAMHKEQERICRQLGNLDGLQRTLGNQALILRDRGDFDGAMVLHKEQERICRQLGEPDSLSHSLGCQAVILQARGNLDGAMVLLKEQERICRQLGYLHGLQRTLGNQPLILEARGDLDGAMALLSEQERICRQLGELDSLSISLCNQASILKSRGEFNGAIGLLREAERICRKLGKLDYLSVSLGIQANILYARGEFDGAMALYKEQEQIGRQLDNSDILQRTLGGQALILRARGDLDGAMALHEEQERLCQQLGNVRGLAISLANQAQLLQHLGRARDGVRLAEEACRLAASNGYAALARQFESDLDAMRGAMASSVLRTAPHAPKPLRSPWWKWW